MAVYAPAQKSGLRFLYRLDAEHYSPRFWPVLNQLRQSKAKKLRQLLREPVRTGHTPSTKNAAYYRDGGIKFIKTDNLREDHIKTHDVQLLSDLGDARIGATGLHPDDIITTIIGATEDIIGRTARVHRELGRANINQNLALIRSSVPAGYLALFLNTKYGREQLIWLSRQTGQVNLNCREVEELAIPLFSDEFTRTIHSLSDRRGTLLRESRTFYEQAESTLMSECGLAAWTPAHELSHVLMHGDAIQSRRLDAEHFQPKYRHLRDNLERYSHGHSNLTDIASLSQEMVDPPSQPDREFEYIELANVDAGIGLIEDANHLKGRDAPSRARMLLRKGDVIASSVEGSLDKVAIVTEEYDNAIGSTGFFVLRPRRVGSGYLFALTKSPIVEEQLRCEASGSILAAVSPGSLVNVLVPSIRLEKRSEIETLVKKSHTARRAADALLARAKAGIETAIEQGETRAMQLLQD